MDFEPDISSMAEEWARQPGRGDQLPVMNFRPGDPRPEGQGSRYAPYAPHLFVCGQLLPYYLVVYCICGRVTEISSQSTAKLLAKAGQAPIQHLLGLLRCDKCKGHPVKMEIGRHADRGLANAPRQIVTADGQHKAL